MKNIKLTALILAAMLTVGVFANISFGQYAETDMEYDDIMLMARSIFPEGEGTEESPFIISTAEQFDIIADLPDLCYELKNDITLPSGWVPIGTSGENFSGTFNGTGHTITITDFSNEGYVGIFAVNNGSISNLKVNVLSSEKRYPERMTWYAGIICGENCGTITNCSVAGECVYNAYHSYSGGSYAYTAYIGSVAGLNSGTIKSCSAKTVCSVSAYYDTEYVGGLAGYNSGIIEDSYYIGDIQASGSRYVGGLLGCNSGTVNRTYAAATVEGDYTGGITACIKNNSTVENSYYDKDVSGLSSTGNGDPKSTLGMKMKAVYEDWDFSYTWGISRDINDGYPYLLSEIVSDEAGELELILTDINFQKSSTGASGSISAQIYNSGSRSISHKVIAAIYNQDGSLAEIKIFDEIARPGLNSFILDDIRVEAGNIYSSYTAKVLVWDSTEGMTSLAESVSFTI